MQTSTSDRVAFLYRVYAAEGIVDDLCLLRAAAQCLSPDEMQRVILAEASHSSALRDAVIRRLTQEPGLLAKSAYEEIATALLSSLAVGDARTRQGVGYCLSTLYPRLPRHAQTRVEAAFLGSRFVGLRRRGYKIQAGLTSPDLNAMNGAWAQSRDPECAWLLAKHFAPEELVARRAELLPALAEPWKVSRLFQRRGAQLNR